MKSSFVRESTSSMSCRASSPVRSRSAMAPLYIRSHFFFPDSSLVIDNSCKGKKVVAEAIHKSERNKIDLLGMSKLHHPSFRAATDSPRKMQLRRNKRSARHDEVAQCRHFCFRGIDLFLQSLHIHFRHPHATLPPGMRSRLIGLEPIELLLDFEKFRCER